MFSSAQGLVKVNNYHFFAGWAYGYQTNLQKLTKPTASLDFDAYLYKYMFDHDSSYSCIYESTINSNTISARITLSVQSKIESTNMVTYYKDNAALLRIQTQNYLIPYASKFSGGFPLLNSMKIPRPCAYKSYNMTQMNYYRGIDQTRYNIATQNNQGFIVTMMDANSQIMYQDGSNASDIATYN